MQVLSKVTKLASIVRNVINFTKALWLTLGKNNSPKWSRKNSKVKPKHKTKHFPHGQDRFDDDREDDHDCDDDHDEDGLR